MKWKGLGYEDATWELESSPFLHTPEALSLMKDYEVRLKGKAAFDSSNGDKVGHYSRKGLYIIDTFLQCSLKLLYTFF